MARMAVPYKNGAVIDWVNGSGSAVAAGDVVPVGNLIGIAVADIADGASGVLEVTGAWVLPAVNNTAFSAGDLLYWDATAKKAAKTEAGNAVLGVCLAGKVQTGTSCVALINQGNVHGLPAGGNNGQILKKNAETSWSYTWAADAINWINGTGSNVAAGDVVVVGCLVGIAVADIANGASGVLEVTGSRVLPAVNNTAFSAGDLLYWDATAKKATKTEAGNTVLGVCLAAKADTGTTCICLINQGNVHGLPAGGDNGQILKKNADTSWSYAWAASA